MALIADNVDYTYAAGVHALRAASLTIEPGRMLGLIGPNGSGKSTLLRVLAGMFRPDGGSVTLDGASVTAMGRRAIARRVAFLPQRVDATFAFTSEEIVAQGRYPRLNALGFLSDDDVGIVRDAMARTDTTVFAARPFEDLSGGERQRVLFASVLAQQADYLLLDEPTSALDLHHQSEIFQLLQAAARAGAAVAVVVHDLNLAAQFCDRLALMSVGRIVAEGAPREVLTLEHLAPVYGGGVAVADNPLTGDPLVMVLAPEVGKEDAPCRF